MKQIFSKSKNFKEEYSAMICRVGKVTPIENSDFLATVQIGGYEIIVRKDQVNEGDIKIYCPIESELNSELLSANNLYDISNYLLNSNKSKVESLLSSGDKENAKKLVGFFTKNGRIRMIKLRGKNSMGFIMNPEDLLKWKPNIDLSDISNHVGESFDIVDESLMIKAYVPPIKEKETNAPSIGRRLRQRNKRLKKLNRIVPGTFSFHYDTMPLERNMTQITPDTDITITEKLHGTSFIISNIEVLRKLTFFEKIKKMLRIKFQDKEFDIVYSSRNVIKNKSINQKVSDGFYTTDVYGEIARKFGPYIPKGMTIYGECVGFEEGTSKCIQKKGGKQYVYGCVGGRNKIMPYRILEKTDKGTVEWDVNKIVRWIRSLLIENPELDGYLISPKVFFTGKAKDLYPDLEFDDNWNENLLNRMKTDKNLLMEQDEPSCPKGTPSEGIVVRINNHPELRAYKLKCIRFLELERNDVDNGVVDSETIECYAQEGN